MKIKIIDIDNCEQEKLKVIGLQDNPELDISELNSVMFRLINQGFNMNIENDSPEIIYINVVFMWRLVD